MSLFPVIPEAVTVHLGAPDAPAGNVTLSFPDYIKNVASSEIYPTWPESAIRANIYAQISFALNRIYTEYYPTRGYDYDITSDTKIDQSFVPGRDIFENIDRIVDDIFTDYVRRQGSIEPLLARYCNGTTSTCEGLSQWGTVTLAEQGYTPYEILQYYFGPDLEIVTDTPVQGITASLPAAPLGIGSTGDDVLSIQLRLNRISTNYPAIPKIPDPQGFYDAPTADAVRAFQQIFDLPITGVVNSATWYRIQYLYNAVKRLNELDSEGLRIGELANRFPDSLRIGDRGEFVRDAQLLLALLGQYENAIPPITADGIFGRQTEQAVIALQRLYGLPESGILDEATYLVLYEAYTGILRSLSPDRFESATLPYPGAPLTLGSRGSGVLALQEYLNRLSEIYPSLGTLTPDGIYGERTRNAVAEFQRLRALPVTGNAGAVTWEAITSRIADLQAGEYLLPDQYAPIMGGDA